MVGRAIVAAHLDISAVTLRRLVEAKVIDDAEPGKMDMDAARVAYIRHLRAKACTPASRGDMVVTRRAMRFLSCMTRPEFLCYFR